MLYVVSVRVSLLIPLVVLKTCSAPLNAQGRLWRVLCLTSGNGPRQMSSILRLRFSMVVVAWSVWRYDRLPVPQMMSTIGCRRVVPPSWATVIPARYTVVLETRPFGNVVRCGRIVPNLRACKVTLKMPAKEQLNPGNDNCRMFDVGNDGPLCLERDVQFP